MTLPSVATVADRLEVSAKTVRRWIETRELRTHRLGRCVGISEGDLQNFIDWHESLRLHREVRILGDAEARARSLSDEVFWLRHALEVSKAGKEKLKAWPLARNGE